ncbi:MAG: RnfH family protein [Burkholderiales bacterium]|nr:RnfH family protein [Burkholderiales bacterium]MDE2433315.1 RnfH family protein [Burkholderiales bacterium]
MVLAETAGLAIEVAVGMGPRQVVRRVFAMPQGVSVRQALQASGLLDQVDGPNWANIATGEWFVGVWGRRAELDHVLRDRDRVEVYRGLKVDPKEARRQRYRAHGEKLPKGIQRSPKKQGEPSS